MTREIPFMQPLSPLALISAKRPAAFPFSAPRAHYFFLARSGIWHAADLLSLVPGDEVLMPAYHHGVEVEVLRSRGLVPRYYGIDAALAPDLHEVAGLVTSRTRLLYVIHYLGFAQRMQGLVALARQHGLALFEDCALSLFSASPEGPLGTHGDVSIFCLYKSLPVPHGGMLVLNRADLVAKPRLRVPGFSSTLGHVANRLLDFQTLRGGAWGRGATAALRSAARLFKRAGGLEPIRIDTNEFDPTVVDLGVSQVAHHILERTDAAAVVRARRENFARLHEALASGVRRLFPALPDGTCPLSYPILVPDKPAVHARLHAEGVRTVTFWSIDNPEIPRGRFPEVDFLRRHVLELPIHQGLRAAEIEIVADAANRHALWDGD